MNRLKKEYIDNINNIIFTDEKNNYLKKETINRYKKKKKKENIVFSLMIMISILLIGTGVSYAEEIRDTINKVIIKINNTKTKSESNYTEYKIESTSKKELNYEANLKEPKCEKVINDYIGISENDECYSLYTYEELEKELGIKLLKNDLFKDNRMILIKVSRVDGKISYIKLRMPNPMNGEKNSNKSTKVWVEIAMRTKYNTNNIDTIWEANLSSDKNVREYNMASINNKAYGTANSRYTQNVFIVDDDIAYRLRIFIGNEYLDNPNEEVQRILDAFHY